MIGLQELERFLQHAQGAVARPLLGLAREECLGAAPAHDLADIPFAPALRSAIDGRSIDVVDAQIERPLHNRHRYAIVVGVFQSCLAAQAEDSYLVSGLPQIAGRHGRLRGGFGWSLGSRGMPEKTSRCRTAELQEGAAAGATR